MCLKEFNINDPIYKKLFNLFIELSIQLLDGGNLEV